MTIDKFGSHISHKYSGKTEYCYCFIPLYIRDEASPFVFGQGNKVLTYNINEVTNRWFYPLPSGTVMSCKVFKAGIKFLINNKNIVNSLEKETLITNDTILVVRPVGSSKTGNGVIELVVKIPISHNE